MAAGEQHSSAQNCAGLRWGRGRLRALGPLALHADNVCALAGSFTQPGRPAGQGAVTPGAVCQNHRDGRQVDAGESRRQEHCVKELVGGGRLCSLPKKVSSPGG